VAAVTTGVIGVAAPSTAATPVAVWHMEETSGTTMVDSAGTNKGTLHSVILGVAGSSGLGYGFNGTSSYVSVPDSPTLDPVASNLTFSVSFKTTSLPAKADWDLARKGTYTTAGGEWKAELQPAGQASCAFKGNLRYRYLQAGPTTLADGKWHTLTCTKTDSAIMLTIDGQTFTKTGKVGSIDNASSVIIGAYPGKEWFKGTLDEVSISTGS
jgi:hypothetical protein